MQVIVDQLLTTYSQLGTSKKVILFLHGWADAGKTFHPLAQELIKENPAYSAVLIDLPGFGGSQQPLTAWGLDNYATFVAHFLEKTGMKSTAIVGHSNGGSIAIYGLSHQILQADRLILIASAGIRDKSAKKTALKVAAKPAKLLLSVTPKATQKRVKEKLYGAIGSDYLIAEHMQETFKRIVAADVRSDAAKLSVKTCIIYGDRDTATPLDYGEQYGQLIKGSKLHIVPMTGHFVHQEQVYKVATIITEFLAKK